MRKSSPGANNGRPNPSQTAPPTLASHSASHPTTAGAAQRAAAWQHLPRDALLPRGRGRRAAAARGRLEGGLRPLLARRRRNRRPEQEPEGSLVSL
eukprot:4860950-Prymnesium_polylepis.1